MHCYIHVPFCARRCSYCDFSIAVRRVTPSREFVKAILTEWALRRNGIAPEAVFQTIYFGGGTPSRLDPAALADLISRLTDAHTLARGAEITIEANPDDITLEHARAWASAGVNRVSLGVQSHDPSVLLWMHRTHSASQVPTAVAMLHAAGIDNISLDLIFGLPSALNRDWDRDLELTMALGPAHISLYGLTVESHTPLARWTARGETQPVSDDRYAAEYLAVHRALVANGFEHYEVSNAGRPGRWSRHNNAYWHGAEYLGLGPSAHSYLGGVRSWNASGWVDYAERVAGGGNPQSGAERLDQPAQLLERRYLGLRTSSGLPATELPASACAAWLDAGWGVLDGDRLRLTAEGWLRLDALVASLGDS